MAETALPGEREFVNSIGMRLVRVEAGRFVMGRAETPLPAAIVPHRFQACGEFDERPVHEVTISRPFFLAVTQVTNAQYERFDPAHRQLRGKMGFSSQDDEAAVFVSWPEAAGFCRWLGEQEGRPYRLPTEAEWEYACRAGTTGPYHTGQTLPEVFHNNVGSSWYPGRQHKGPPNVPTSCFVGRTPPNGWGLCDMHGNVEEWCLDWYGPYQAGEQVDPIGPADGDTKVTRGGSHSSELYFLRSANRSAAIPDDKHWLIGFRVAMGEMPASKPALPSAPRRWQVAVSQSIPKVAEKGPAPGPNRPVFAAPRPFVKIPPGSKGPLFSNHNHCPAICQCPNGDLLAIWYSTVQEHTREVTVAGSRLRAGKDEWDEADVFWSVADRNNHASALLCVGETIYHFNGLSAAATWGNLALIVRTSSDSGASFSKARLINPEHGDRNMPVAGAFGARSGELVFACDDNTLSGTAIWVSRDDGQTWHDPGGTIAGIHAGVVELADGRLLAFGRDRNIAGKMPRSISADFGQTWTYQASPFPPIGGGQRLTLLRLAEGPIFFASFAEEMMVTDASGSERLVSGLFAAVSFDEGQTWPIRRLVSDDAPPREMIGMDGHPFTMGPSSAEPRGYLASCQGRDGTIHLISSYLHYALNLAWLKTLPPAVQL